MAKNKKETVKQELQELPIVIDLESRCKLGLRTERRYDPADFEPTYSLVGDDPNPDATEPVRLTPFCTVQALTTLIQGALYFQPLLVKLSREVHKNAEAPAEDGVQPAKND